MSDSLADERETEWEGEREKEGERESPAGCEMGAALMDLTWQGHVNSWSYVAHSPTTAGIAVCTTM